LANIADATRRGKMMWIGKGEHELVTSHIDNVCHAVDLGLERAGGGQAYFIFDDGKVSHRDWLTRLLETQGLAAPEKRIPYAVAWLMASMLELIWRLTRKDGGPPITRALVRMTGREFTVSDRKARNELGYAPIVSRDDGVRQLTRR